MKQFSLQNSNIYDCYYIKFNVLPVNIVMPYSLEYKSLQESVTPKFFLWSKRKKKNISTELENYC